MDLADGDVSMVLPKGIVVNTDHVYQEVASHRILPGHKVHEYWHVYTTTHKQLEDPTARRLENFWWHVWGSDRRLLDGRVLARLYEHISLGPTFVPLRGPPNRWEGPEVPPSIRQVISSAVGTQAAASGPREHHGPSVPRASASSQKSTSSSASQPPPPTPILKKSRGTSSSGPRHTARFISPKGSGDEADKDDESAPLPSIAAASSPGVVSPSPAGTPSPAKKRSGGMTKRFLAPSTSAKRRPVLPRRASSQSSTGSESASRDGASWTSSRSATGPRVVSPIPEGASNITTPQSHGIGSSGPPPSPQLSARAAGKRPAPSVGASAKRTPSRDRIATRQARVVPAQAQDALKRQPRNALPQVQSLVSLPAARSGEAAAFPYLGLEPAQSAQGATQAPAMGRSQSHTGYGRHGGGRADGGDDRVLTPGLFTEATAATTNIAAQGTIIDQSGLDSRALPSLAGRQREGLAMPSRPSQPSVLDLSFRPTPPTSSAYLPMGRTKSQLTLLLEREKARTGDKARRKS